MPTVTDACDGAPTITNDAPGRFFFGGAVSDAEVNYSVSTEPYFFNYDGPGFYDFNDIDFDSGPGEFYGFYGEEIESLLLQACIE